MNPNDPQQPYPPAPQPEAPAPQPYPQPEAQPVAAPVAPAEYPAQPAPQQYAASEPVAPVAPSPFGAPAAAPIAPAQPGAPIASGPVGPTPGLKKPFPKKLAILIGAIVGGVAVLAVLAVVVVNLIAANSLPLKTYEGSSYTILVPEKYEVDEKSSSVTFTEPDAEKDEESSMSVSAIEDFPAEYRDQFLKSIDENLTEEKLKEAVESSSSSDTGTFSNFNIEKTTQGDFEARIMTADVKKDGGQTGKVRFVYLIGDDAVYIISILAHSSDIGLSNQAQKITDSFTVK